MGNRIKDLRLISGITQKELALKIGITQPALSNYESGRTPNSEITGKLADFFGVSVAYLLGLSDSPKDPFFLDPVAIALDDRKLFEQMVDTTSQWDGSDYSELVPSAVKEKIGKNLHWFSHSYEALVKHYDTPDAKIETEIEPGIARLLDLELDIIEKLSYFHYKMNKELCSGAKLDSSIEYVLEFIAGFLEREYRWK
ncbi:helix-turn-helix domain-containing protein [Ligilactobacillus agilis]|uniref:helix-turn-helix domain-containing protein n=1 Tax=Ligilactobacillus agilis TaxID=1601 RepID=UPI001959EAAC|nr:helix-turn-helix domain-containing protein [Ligilactobacillus agilis]MBM6763686.1 helix-turn-helix domain-containing protein [Ligilactobacillus agilis]